MVIDRLLSISLSHEQHVREKLNGKSYKVYIYGKGLEVVRLRSLTKCVQMNVN